MTDSRSRARLAILCSVLFALVSLTVSVARSDSSGDKNQVVESGYITKIDLKKKIVTIHGTIDTPIDGAKIQGRGGGGRGGGGRGGGRGGAGGGSADQPLRELKIYARDETVIQQDKTTLELKDLKEEDYIMAVGTARGKSSDLDAELISITTR